MYDIVRFHLWRLTTNFFLHQNVSFAFEYIITQTEKLLNEIQDSVS